ncbi:MAG: flagellar hook-associated protein FlgK [Rhodospirillales bacterium]|nr:flagellar hook-associated protein FlgK [Rhodospirillales bacterium]
MSLFGAFSIANGGLGNISRQLAVVSQNVSNATTPDYAREIATQTSVTAGGQGLGVATGAVGRVVDPQMQALLTTQNGVVTGLTTRQAALQQIDGVQAAPGSGGDLASLLGKMQAAFSTLGNDPSNQTQQQAVVAAAQRLAAQINGLSSSIQTARQSAQDGIVSGVQTVNATLAQIGGLSDQIIRLQAAGQSTADLQNQRDAALHTLSQYVDVRMIAQPNGDATLITPSGLTLQTHGTQPPLAAQAAAMGPSLSYPGGGVPEVTLNGVDVTNQLSAGQNGGGSIGANITLRDQTLPTYQAELDEFASTISNRVAAQGLTLFTDASGAIPTSTGVPTQSGYLGYAGTIQVNPAVQANPTLVRDGTASVAGSATGASAFTPNSASGPAGFNILIIRVLTYALGSQAQAGVPQPAPAVTGLGVAGTLAAPFLAPTDLASFAGLIVGSQAQDSAAATAQLSMAQGVQSSLQSKVSAASGVSMDTEMSSMIQLQNAYGANAKVISVVQALWTQLLQMVP